MKKFLLAAAAGALSTTGALAGGIDRSLQSVAPVFEPGRYVEFSYRSVDPNVSGTGVVLTPGVASGEALPGYGTVGTAFKMPVNDKIDIAFIYDQPFGADVAYPLGTGYFATGSTAALDTNSFTVVGRHKFGERFSAFAGFRYQDIEAGAMIPFVAGYAATTAKTGDFGFLAGAAYEIPEYRLRVALTYNSAITHDLDTVETSLAAPLPGISSTTEIKTPQSVNLEFQSGVNKNTLVRGYVRWVNWSDFEIDPVHYRALTTSILNPTGSALVSFNDDTITYNVQVIRALNETWALAGSLTYEAQTGGFSSNLSPRDGFTSVGLGAIYRQDGFRLSAGLSYVWVGDAITQGPVPGTTAASFTNNDALAFGMKASFNF